MQWLSGNNYNLSFNVNGQGFHHVFSCHDPMGKYYVPTRLMYYLFPQFPPFIEYRGHVHVLR